MTQIANYWQYVDNFCPALPDPRLPISQQMQWVNPNSTITPWTGVEPDNYNYAIFDTRPHDLDFIQDQCFYKIDMTHRRKRIQGWMSVYVTEEHEKFNQVAPQLKPIAYWRSKTAKPYRTRRTIMQRELRANTAAGSITTEERLWQMGFFDVYKHKYLDDESYLKVVGVPRGIAQDLLYEHGDYKVDDSNESVLL